MSDTATLKVSKVMVDVETLQDILDCMAVLDFTGHATMCRGKRYVMNGYVCTHCQSDDPSRKCLAPKGKEAPINSPEDFVSRLQLPWGDE